MKRRYWFPKHYSDEVAKLRVPAGFVLAGAFAWLSAPAAWSLAAGLPLSLAGMLLRSWAAGHLAKNESLARTGPYAYLRNPLYAGTCLVAAGLVVAARQWWLAVLFSAVFLLVYLPVIELEEQHLRQLFPDYAGYAREVPVLWPRWRRGAAWRGFRWSQWKRNQEYNAWLGFLAGVGWLIWKSGLAGF